jgi:hypothetical protein
MFVQDIDHPVAQPPQKKEGTNEGESRRTILAIVGAKQVEEGLH